MLALILWSTLAAAGELPAGDTTVPEAAPAVKTPVPELRLGGGAFVLKVNTGWFSAQDARQDPAPAGFDAGAAVNLRDRRGHLHLGGGDERRLRLAVQWDVDVDSEMARVHSQIDLGFFGHTLTLTPPDVRVRPRFDGGQPGVEVNVPIVEGRF